MLLLDTHVLVWLDQGSPRLGKEAIQAIDKALRSQQLGVASISFGQVAMQVRKKRPDIDMELHVWRRELLQNGLQEIPPQGSTGLRAGQLEVFHGDPVDRMHTLAELNFEHFSKALILAHGITNLGLGIYVVATGSWMFW